MKLDNIWGIKSLLLLLFVWVAYHLRCFAGLKWFEVHSELHVKYAGNLKVKLIMWFQLAFVAVS